MLIGLLAVDPHRLFLYWELPGGNGLTMSLFNGSGRISTSRNVGSAGTTYLSGLEAGDTYRVEIRRARHLVARSNEIALPPVAGRAAEHGLPLPSDREWSGGAGSSFLSP
ncbi:MAG: hypothetical protein ACKV22_39200 [Bryobacteraceae bacterium]